MLFLQTNHQFTHFVRQTVSITIRYTKIKWQTIATFEIIDRYNVLISLKITCTCQGNSFHTGSFIAVSFSFSLAFLSTMLSFNFKSSCPLLHSYLHICTYKLYPLVYFFANTIALLFNRLLHLSKLSVQFISLPFYYHIVYYIYCIIPRFLVYLGAISIFLSCFLLTNLYVYFYHRIFISLSPPIPNSEFGPIRKEWGSKIK